MTVAALLAILAVLYAVFLFVHYLGRAEIKLSVRNGRAEISVPLFSWSFRLADIDNLQVLDSTPFGMRTGGFLGMKRVGPFHAEKDGLCRVYVSHTKKPVLMISLRDAHPCLLNGETQKQMALWRNMLLGPG